MKTVVGAIVVGAVVVVVGGFGIVKHSRPSSISGHAHWYPLSLGLSRQRWVQ